jgi:antirestriction protein ArdC
LDFRRAFAVSSRKKGEFNMNEKVKQVLASIVDTFKSGKIPEAVALASFPVPNIPSTQWSFMNRTLMVLSGTVDARGFRQWKEADRWVKKGSKAIHILVPCFKKIKDEDTGDENDVLCFFKASPVFRYEDTDGKELEYRQIELPELPLIERAKTWGIDVKAIPGNYKFRGYYSQNRSLIALATPEEKTFFHELSHAAHEKVKGSLKAGQDPLQEIVAELSAQALCRLVGKRTKETLGNTYEYIERYAKKVNLNPYRACLKVLSETESVLNTILKGG